MEKLVHFQVSFFYFYFYQKGNIESVWKKMRVTGMIYELFNDAIV